MKAVVIGSSMGGMVSALALARAGVTVTILEADDTPLPRSMGPTDVWRRSGVPHLTQAHNFMSLFVQVMQDVTPGFIDDVERAGAIVRRSEELMSPAVAERKAEIPGDHSDMVVLSARRPFVESMLRERVLATKNVELRSPVKVTTLLSSWVDGHPHVTGVVSNTGESMSADVVIDASGRRTQVDEWLASIGARPPAFLMEPANQIYFTRYYVLKRTDGFPPLNNGFSTVQPFPWGSVLMFPGDNSTIQVAIGSLPEDTEMKRVRDEAIFQRMATMSPAVAPWVEPEAAEPVGGVSAMGGLNNYLRRLIVDGEPVVTGLHLVGDSAAITNPQYGRGASHAASHGAIVSRIVIDETDDPLKQAVLVDEEVGRMLLPSIQTSIRSDRFRAAAWRDAIGISELAPPRASLPDVPADPNKAFLLTKLDPVVWYRVTRGGFLLEPPGSWVHDPQLVDRVNDADIPPAGGPSPPTRQEVMEALS